MRTDLHPLLVAPAIGTAVELTLTERLIETLAAAGHMRAAARARRLIRRGERTVTATVELGVGRAVTLPGGERMELCEPDHLIHLRIKRLAGEELLTVRAGDCDLPAAPPAADAALEL